MLRSSRTQKVVFTQAYPALEAFADEYFTSSHPLRYSPVWIEENDIRYNDSFFSFKGLTSPLALSRHAATIHSHRHRPAGKRRVPAVPICSASICQSLLLLNAEQMSLGGEGDEVRVRQHITENTLRCQGICSEVPSTAAAPSTAAGARHHYPSGSIATLFPPTLQHRMVNAMTFRPFMYLDISNALLRIQDQEGYTSGWWATLSQWRRLGAVPAHRNVCAHRVCFSVTSKLIHVSLLEDPIQLLSRSFVSPHHRLLSCFSDADVRAYEAWKADPMWLQTTGYPEWRLSRLRYKLTIQRDMEARRTALLALGNGPAAQAAAALYFPLYLSPTHIRRAGLAVLPNAAMTEWIAALPPALASVGSDLSEYSTSPWRSPACENSAEAAAATIYFYHYSQLQSGTTGEPLQLTESVLAAIRRTLTPAADSTPQRQQQPVHGLTGQLLHYPELQIESLQQHACHVGLASRLTHHEVSQHQGADGDLEPLALSRCSVWFRASDVLALQALVDVNGAPVEVQPALPMPAQVNHSHGSSYEEYGGGMMAHISTLSDPSVFLSVQ